MNFKNHSHMTFTAPHRLLMCRWILSAALGVLMFCGAAGAETLSAPVAADQVRAGDFDKLENYFQNLSTQPLDRNGNSPLQRALDSFPVEPDLAAHLDQWCEQRSSKWPRLVRGHYLLELAWQARGTGWGYTVSEAGENVFLEHLDESQLDFEKALEIDSSDSYAAKSLMIIGRALYESTDNLQRQFDLLGKGDVGAAQRLQASLSKKTLHWTRERIEAYFQQAVQSDPLSLAPYGAMLEFLTPKWHGSAGEMMAFARKAAVAGPRGSLIPYVLIRAHRELASDRSYYEDPTVWVEVEGIYARLLEDFPDSDVLRAGHAVLAAFAGKYSIANAEFNRIKSYGDISAFRFSEIQLALTTLRRTSEIASVAQSWQEGDPSDPERPYEVGMIYVKNFDPESAKPYFEKSITLSLEMLKAYPNNAALLYTLGLAQYYTDPETAAQTIAKYIRLQPLHANAHVVLGNLYAEKLNKPDLARTFFEKGLEMDPVNSHLRYGLAKVVEATDPKRAEKEYRLGVLLDPRDLNGRVRYALMLFNSGRLDESQNEYLAITKLEPAYGPAWYAVGNVYCEKNQHQKAVPYFEKALKLGIPGCPQCIEFANSVVSTLKKK